MELFTALIIGSIVSSLMSAGLSYASSIRNEAAQRDINQQNVESQERINQQNVEATAAINQQNIDYSKEFAQNNIQWKMADLEAAGLNPTMAAGLGGSASPGTLSVPNQAAAKQQAPFFDMSGVSSALNAMSNMMMTSYILNQRNDIASGRNEILSDRNNVLRGLYQRKAQYLNPSSASPVVGNAKQLAAARQAMSEAMTPEQNQQWDDFLKALKKGKFK